MLSLRHPTPAAIEQFLARQAAAPFSYGDLGCTRDTPPAGYFVDRYRVFLGRGDHAFSAARAALRR